MIEEKIDIFENINTYPDNVKDTYICLSSLSNKLHLEGDYQAIFPDLYAIITKHVMESIEGKGIVVFNEPLWMSRLTGHFCHLYVQALQASRKNSLSQSKSWDKLSQICKEKNLPPTLTAFCAVNAHINDDLPVGLNNNIKDTSKKILLRYYQDHCSINKILEASMPEILRLMKDKYRCPVASIILENKLVEEFFIQFILHILAEWREEAWYNLLSIINSPAKYNEVIKKMNTKSLETTNYICRLGKIFRIVSGKVPTLYWKMIKNNKE